jgi:DNA invertase Pin-like site-specific DNA recombinase
MRRPILEKILFKLNPGDTVIVYKLDRMARSLKDLLRILERMQLAGAEFKSLTEVIDTNSPAGRMMLQILGAFAEFEREMIRERTLVGMAAAKERGAKFGRPRGLNPREEIEALQMWRSGFYSKTSIAKVYCVHISSIKRMIWRADDEAQSKLDLAA